MEQELTNMLELLRQGLSELPAIGSDVFNIYIRGIQIEGGVKVATYVIIILIVTYLIRYFKKEYDNLNSDKRSYRDTLAYLELLIVALSFALVIVSIVACFGVYSGVMRLFAPDYILIKEVIEMLAI